MSPQAWEVPRHYFFQEAFCPVSPLLLWVSHDASTVPLSHGLSSCSFLSHSASLAGRFQMMCKLPAPPPAWPTLLQKLSSEAFSSVAVGSVAVVFSSNICLCSLVTLGASLEQLSWILCQHFLDLHCFGLSSWTFAVSLVVSCLPDSPWPLEP